MNKEAKTLKFIFKIAAVGIGIGLLLRELGL